MDTPNLRPPLSEALFTDRNLFQSLSELYASKNFNRGVLLKNADFQRQNKKTYVRRSKMQSESAPSSPASSSPLSLKRLSTDEVKATRSFSSDEDIDTQANLTSPTKTTSSEATNAFNNININITNSSSNIGTTTDVKLTTSTVTQSDSSLHAIATAASIVATTTTTTAALTSTINSAPSSPSINVNSNIKRRKLDSSSNNSINNNNNNNNSNLNVHVKVDVSFEETVAGCKKMIEYDCFVLCDKCGGNGRGAASSNVAEVGGAEGSSCAQCNGMVWKTKKRIEVDILPNGVKNGFKKTYKGLGSKGEDGTSGDLIVEFVVANHPFYRRNGDDDTICECHISIYQAVLGTKIQIPKLYGSEGEKVEVRIEPGIQPNTVIRMPNQGMTKSNCKKKRGDLFIHVIIDIPTQLTQQQKDLFERLATIDSMLDLHLSSPSLSSPPPSSPISLPLPLITKSHSTSSLPTLKNEKL